MYLAAIVALADQHFGRPVLQQGGARFCEMFAAEKCWGGGGVNEYIYYIFIYVYVYIKHVSAVKPRLYGAAEANQLDTATSVN
jgi:hypothetical protein